MSELETLLVEREGKVATIFLNRPDRLNAYTTTMGAELFRTLHELDQDDGTRAIVVTGKGKGFCAGMDLDGGGGTFADEGIFEETRRLGKRVEPWNMGTPVIAAINGAAVGIGATLPLQWDIRLASDKARIGFVFTRRGIMPEAHSSWILPRLIGMAKASELLLTGRLIGADEALAFGIVSRVIPHDQLLDEARAVARDIATNTSPASVAMTKRLLWRQWMQHDPRPAKELEDALFAHAGASDDAAEGVKSFLEKRAPDWTTSANALPDGLDDLD